MIQIHLLHGVLIQGITKKVTESGDHLVRIGGVFFKYQRRDCIKGVKQKMRIQLVSQHPQLRLVRHRFRLNALLNLLLQLAIELQAEIQSTPPQHQGVRQLNEGTEVITHNAVFFHQLILAVIDELCMILNGLPDKRHQEGRRQNANYTDLDRLFPNRDIKVAQRSGKDKTGTCIHQ